MTDHQPDPQPDRTADEAKLDQLKKRAEELTLELRARGGSFPLGQFELLFRSQQIIVLEQSVTAARRAMFTDAARGNGNGQIPKLR